MIHLAYQPICLLACLPTFLPKGYMSSQRSRHCERTEGGRRGAGKERGERAPHRAALVALVVTINMFHSAQPGREREGQGEVRCGDGRLAWHVSGDEGEVFPPFQGAVGQNQCFSEHRGMRTKVPLRNQVNYIWIKIGQSQCIAVRARIALRRRLQ